MGDYCYKFLCFIPLDSNAPKFFGFSEFLAGLALMVLAWTIADVRYRFRVKTAPLPLESITFGMVSTIGILTLITDLWRAEQWLVPQGNILTPATWQAFLGGLFLLTFLTWAWFAFIRPPVYGKRNAKRYGQTLYKSILKGSPSELAIIADELTHSVKSLIKHSTNFQRDIKKDQANAQPQLKDYTNEILLLIADKRFCHAVVDSSPGTALVIFQEIAQMEKYHIPIETFAKNIVNEAISNRSSFLYHEIEGYESGLLGYHKPLCQAMFANYAMVESIGTLLDPDISAQWKWDALQWEAYSRIVLITFRDYVGNGLYDHSFVLYRALNNIEKAVFDLYKINGIEISGLEDDTQNRLQIVVEFIIEAVDILNKKDVSKDIALRTHKKNDEKSIYDHIAKMIVGIIFSASTVRTPMNQCWWIQHNSVWAQLFNFARMNGIAGNIIKFKVRRLLYDEISNMSQFPNFKGAKILGFCLNVMGLILSDHSNDDRDSRSLHKAILSWTKRNYSWLALYHPNVAENCLVDGITYDAENLRLVKTYSTDGLRHTPRYTYFYLDPPENHL